MSPDSNCRFGIQKVEWGLETEIKGLANFGRLKGGSATGAFVETENGTLGGFLIAGRLRYRIGCQW